MCGESNPNGPRIGWLLCVDAPTATHRACAIFLIHTHILVPDTGFEPVRPLRKQQILSLRCLPFHHPGSNLSKFWCVERDSNSQSFRHWLLRPACIPFHHRRNERIVQQNHFCVAFFFAVVFMVGVVELESTTLASQTRCATRLRYTPNNFPAGQACKTWCARRDSNPQNPGS